MVVLWLCVSVRVPSFLISLLLIEIFSLRFAWMMMIGRWNLSFFISLLDFSFSNIFDCVNKLLCIRNGCCLLLSSSSSSAFGQRACQTNEQQINQITSSLSLTGGGTRIKLALGEHKNRNAFFLDFQLVKIVDGFGLCRLPISPADHFYDSACSLSRTVKPIVVISQWVYGFSPFCVRQTIDIKIEPMRVGKSTTTKMNIQSHWWFLTIFLHRNLTRDPSMILCVFLMCCVPFS